MKIEGYRLLNEIDGTDAFPVFISDDVHGLLTKEGRTNNRKHVRKVAATLTNIQRNGLNGVSNTTLFVREGKFPSGLPGMSDIAVYAAKSWQLRIYGGLIKVRGVRVFLCPEGAIKKQDRADQAQLQRVAKVLGGWNER